MFVSIQDFKKVEAVAEASILEVKWLNLKTQVVKARAEAGSFKNSEVEAEALYVEEEVVVKLTASTSLAATTTTTTTTITTTTTNTTTTTTATTAIITTNITTTQNETFSI